MTVVLSTQLFKARLNKADLRMGDLYHIKRKDNSFCLVLRKYTNPI